MAMANASKEDLRSASKADAEPPVLGDDKTLNAEDTLNDAMIPGRYDRIAIEDWSGTGKGSHVDFDHGDHVPLEQGRFLGRGAMGEVYETIIKGCKVAHKKVYFKRKMGDADKKEIEILKKLSSHDHMIQLVGTYTHRKFLGLLLYPVAVCDLHTFFEDIEAWTDASTQVESHEECIKLLDPGQVERLTALGYEFPKRSAFAQALPVYTKLGCLISAIAYLHDQKIRHKDLKPSNILLAKSRLWLSDFGSATDFSLFSHSRTDNGGGTLRYLSPEVATYKPSGRSADMFSLGCILLEIFVLHERGNLSHIQENRSSDPAFHANLDRVEKWCAPLQSRIPAREHHLLQEISFLLCPDPSNRPHAKTLLKRVTCYEIAHEADGRQSLFGDCCKSTLFSSQQLASNNLAYEEEIRGLEILLQHSASRNLAYKDEIQSLQLSLRELNVKILDYKHEIRRLKLDLQHSQNHAYLKMQEQNRTSEDQRSSYVASHEAMRAMLVDHETTIEKLRNDKNQLKQRLDDQTRLSERLQTSLIATKTVQKTKNPLEYTRAPRRHNESYKAVPRPPSSPSKAKSVDVLQAFSRDEGLEPMTPIRQTNQPYISAAVPQIYHRMPEIPDRVELFGPTSDDLDPFLMSSLPPPTPQPESQPQKAEARKPKTSTKSKSRVWGLF